MAGTHALLSPSASSRWLICTPSAKLEAATGLTVSSVYADEGTLAHKLGELMIRYKLGWILTKPYQKELKAVTLDPLYTLEMYDHCENYATFVMERYTEALSHTKDALIFLEQKINLTDWIPEGHGTADVIIIANTIMDDIDLKYGKGVPVSAEDNPQMKVYGLGSLKEFDHLYSIEKVRLTIYQPRIDNISTWEIAAKELEKWGEETLKPRAALAFEGKGYFEPGSHCRFCKIKATCRANRDHQLEIARHEFKNPDLLEPADIADVLDRYDSFLNWIKAVEEYALHEAVSNGAKWPGYKIVEGRSVRVYSDESKVQEVLLANKMKPEEITKSKLLGITEMTKLLGMTDFNRLLSPLLIKPPGKPKLAPVSDKRPEFNSANAAREDFAGVVIDEDI